MDRANLDLDSLIKEAEAMGPNNRETVPILIG